MAIFKCPRITTEQRINLVITEAEIVFDVNLKRYYGGDNSTQGGFPIGAGAEPFHDLVTISEQDILDKKITLQNSSTNTIKTMFHFINGTTQLLGIDYQFISPNEISWDGLGLDGFIEAGDVILIVYF
jgi:hypothetical protein